MHYSKNDAIHFSKFTSKDEIDESNIYTKVIFIQSKHDDYSYCNNNHCNNYNNYSNTIFKE